MTTAPAPLPQKASVTRVLIDQRKTELVAVGMMILSLWFFQAGSWILPISLIVGIALGLLNHLAKEFSLLRVITGGHQPTRGQLTRSTVVRLAVLTVLAAAAVVVLWRPDHYAVFVLFGLAVFQLIALVMTTIPLLKELRNQ